MYNSLMFRTLNKNKKLYLSLVVISIIFVYIVDVYVYFNNSNKNRLEKKVLYFPSTTIHSSLSPEVHNIPLISPFNDRKSINNSSLEVFLKELFLGPQSIYNKNPIYQFIQLEHVMYNKLESRGIAFIFLSFDDSVSSKERFIANSEKIAMIKEWLLFNIKTYYSIDTITIFLEGVEI